MFPSSLWEVQDLSATGSLICLVWPTKGSVKINWIRGGVLKSSSIKSERSHRQRMWVCRKHSAVNLEYHNVMAPRDDVVRGVMFTADRYLGNGCVPFRRRAFQFNRAGGDLLRSHPWKFHEA